MFSYFEPNFIENFLGKVVFKILAKIEMTRNKNRLFGHHFETVQHLFVLFYFILFYFILYYLFIYFFRIMIFFIVRTYKGLYGANFIAKFRW